MPQDDDDSSDTGLVAQPPKLPWYKRWIRWLFLKLRLTK